MDNFSVFDDRNDALLLFYNINSPISGPQVVIPSSRQRLGQRKASTDFFFCIHTQSCLLPLDLFYAAITSE
uniref:Ovule protein n=1 Tax=Heterorhabditis bacteriophora TaxID=37862 RepID=A0A1I7WSR9_HETBA